MLIFMTFFISDNSHLDSYVIMKKHFIAKLNDFY